MAMVSAGAVTQCVRRRFSRPFSDGADGKAADPLQVLCRGYQHDPSGPSADDLLSHPFRLGKFYARAALTWRGC